MWEGRRRLVGQQLVSKVSPSLGSSSFPDENDLG